MLCKPLTVGLLLLFSGSAGAHYESPGPDNLRLNYLRIACNAGDGKSCLSLIRLRAWLCADGDKNSCAELRAQRESSQKTPKNNVR
jgi:hypothetical protein